ncbi:3-demethylubiquinone-9 3-methyltransferase [Devosia sp. LC5]|uniref:VOC family protein n=1 Tax=Devosia sp. LC5 TaxID=1502724 RepID=UPI0004E2BDAA|nr:VOC family protein [Devosia sp. LC5]KFC66370.1 3-demethylubiquinone-9 3-methyltransferase [Devosia sp. LC5]
MTDIMPCLWFDNRIDEAIEFYTSTFKSAKVHEVTHQDPNGPAFTAVIELEGYKFMLLNGGPQFKFTEAVSFMINVDGQDEVDYFWDRLTADGGAESQCGWCKDKFGLSWQVVPKQIYETVLGKDPAGSQRAMQAMLKMGKLIVADLQKAYAGA